MNQRPKLYVSKDAPILKWQGWLGSNQRMSESKSDVLPLDDTPIRVFKNILKCPKIGKENLFRQFFPTGKLAR